MKNTKQEKLLRKLILGRRSNNRLWMALVAVFTGTVLLLLSVMIWWNFKEVLQGKNDSDSLGSTFLTISKEVTDENMGKPRTTLFTYTEIDALNSLPQVKDVGVLTSNRFPVYATLSARLGFSTEMFLEAVPDRFIDSKPIDWAWQPGSTRVPIIISSDFLNLYNYGFALSQGLPQLSKSSIKALAFDLVIGKGANAEIFTANVVGFSDRISSVLVPQSFIDYGNQKLAPEMVTMPSRLIVKVSDPSNEQFVKFLSSRNYTTNSELLRWNKLRRVVDAVSSATGLLAILLMAIGAMVFILFIELTVARAQESLKLLLTLGYSPRYLSVFMLKRFIPLLIVVLMLSGVVAIVAQQQASVWVKSMELQIAEFPGWPVWLALVVSIAILVLFVSRAVMVSIRKK